MLTELSYHAAAKYICQNSGPHGIVKSNPKSQRSLKSSVELFPTVVIPSSIMNSGWANASKLGIKLSGITDAPWRQFHSELRWAVFSGSVFIIVSYSRIAAANFSSLEITYKYLRLEQCYNACMYVSIIMPVTMVSAVEIYFMVTIQRKFIGMAWKQSWNWTIFKIISQKLI